MCLLPRRRISHFGLVLSAPPRLYVHLPRRRLQTHLEDSDNADFTMGHANPRIHAQKTEADFWPSKIRQPAFPRSIVSTSQTANPVRAALSQICTSAIPSPSPTPVCSQKYCLERVPVACTVTVDSKSMCVMIDNAADVTEQENAKLQLSPSISFACRTSLQEILPPCRCIPGLNRGLRERLDYTRDQSVQRLPIYDLGHFQFGIFKLPARKGKRHRSLSQTGLPILRFTSQQTYGDTKNRVFGG